MASAYICEEAPRTLVCKACGAAFLYARSGRGRIPSYCSDDCRPFRNTEKSRSCLQCGSLFTASGGGRHTAFCSRECRDLRILLRARERSKALVAAHVPEQRPCIDCGKPFGTYVGSSASLCASCINRRGQTGRAANAAIRKARTCEQCGIAFKEGSLSSKQIAAGKRQRFCSVKCNADSKRVYNNRAEAKAAYVERKRERLGLSPVFRATERECSGCSAKFIAKSKDTRKCSSCRSPLVPRMSKPCSDCGTEVVGTAAKRRCSKCVRKRARELQVSKHGKVSKHRHRARKFGVAYEPINPISIFDRDGWKCQICGVKTPKKMRGTLADNAPELDHRVPMAMGGPHTRDNVQLACRACNQAKGGTKISGQLRLFA